jgi:hypothetical protein
MTLTTPFDRSALRGTLDEIIDHHGLVPVLRALVARPFRSRQALPPLGLNDHLRRDVGLEPLPLWGDPLL